MGAEKRSLLKVQKIYMHLHVQRYTRDQVRVFVKHVKVSLCTLYSLLAIIRNELNIGRNWHNYIT